MGIVRKLYRGGGRITHPQFFAFLNPYMALLRNFFISQIHIQRTYTSMCTPTHTSMHIRHPSAIFSFFEFIFGIHLYFNPYMALIYTSMRPYILQTHIRQPSILQCIFGTHLYFNAYTHTSNTYWAHIRPQFFHLSNTHTCLSTISISLLVSTHTVPYISTDPYMHPCRLMKYPI